MTISLILTNIFNNNKNKWNMYMFLFLQKIKKCDKVSAPTPDFNPNWYKATKTINLNQALPASVSHCEDSAKETLAPFGLSPL
jgi:hypothetical protein